MGISFADEKVLEPSSGGIFDAELRESHAELWPSEVAFLADEVSPGVLHVAVQEADRLGVTADRLLLAEGLITSDRFYRALARHLGLPFAEHPLRPVPDVEIGAVLTSGLLPVRAHARAAKLLAAPRGESLTRFLDLLEGCPYPQRLPVSITTPERLEALLRHDRRHEILKNATFGLPDWDRSLSAQQGVAPGQAMTFCAAAVVFCVSAWIAPFSSSLAVFALFTVAFLLAVILRLSATGASLTIAKTPSHLCDDHELPVYSVIVPLFREARVVERLVSALDRLDHPRAKLDVLLVVEASDTGTLNAIDGMRLPARYRTIVAPPGRPRTKPRALNVALQFARGSHVVIFDAEDEPEPGQLRAAATAFRDDASTACVQARLAIDNAGDGWLAALFAIEYAALFHVINPGLAALGLPIPLGGTSNHFRVDVLRTINGWDAWNVTEDIDLGIRLARFGHRVRSLDSTTFEEAPNTLAAWLKQRRRWMKGWMVTLGTHSRAPLRLWRELGSVKTLAVSALLFGTVVSSLLGPFCIVMVLVRATTRSLFWVRTPSDLWWNGASATLLALGALTAVWPAVLGLHRRGMPQLSKWLAVYPVYLVLLSIASWQALFEVFGRPHAWAKTEHGRAKQRVNSIPAG